MNVWLYECAQCLGTDHSHLASSCAALSKCCSRCKRHRIALCVCACSTNKKGGRIPCQHTSNNSLTPAVLCVPFSNPASPSADMTLASCSFDACVRAFPMPQGACQREMEAQCVELQWHTLSSCLLYTTRAASRHSHAVSRFSSRSACAAWGR